MTSDGYSFNDFPENQLTKCCVVQTVLRPIRTILCSKQNFSLLWI